MGCERALLAPSTLHLYWDLFDVLAADRIAIYVDAGAYPIARWGVERRPRKAFRHRRSGARSRCARGAAGPRSRRGRRPVVVADGLCTETGRTAPLPDYLKLVRERNGRLVIDDTQALGILGRDPGAEAPYGRGGAGTPAWNGVEGPELIIGSSLAKGFGAPLAVLAGNATLMSKFEQLGATQSSLQPALSRRHRRRAAGARRQRDARQFSAQPSCETRSSFRESLRQIGLSALAACFRFKH